MSMPPGSTRAPEAFSSRRPRMVPPSWAIRPSRMPRSQSATEPAVTTVPPRTTRSKSAASGIVPTSAWPARRVPPVSGWSGHGDGSGYDDHRAVRVPGQPARHRAGHVMPGMPRCPHHQGVRGRLVGRGGELTGRAAPPGHHPDGQAVPLGYLVQLGQQPAADFLVIAGWPRPPGRSVARRRCRGRRRPAAAGGRAAGPCPPRRPGRSGWTASRRTRPPPGGWCPGPARAHAADRAPDPARCARSGIHGAVPPGCGSTVPPRSRLRAWPVRLGAGVFVRHGLVLAAPSPPLHRGNI